MKIAAAKDPSRYFCALHTLFDTRAYDPDKTLAEERAKGRPESLIRQEYLCDWTAANVGAIWGDLIEVLEKSGAVSDFDHSPDRVFTTWDLGGAGARGDSTSFWVWSAKDGGVDLIDYYEAHGKSLSHYFDEVEKRRAALGVRFVKHWLPHDARAKALGTGLSVLEQCAAQWGGAQVAIYPEMGLLDGIQAGRWLLQQPVRIHTRCSEGLEAIKAYHYNWDDDRKTFSNVPEHDWSSHGSDAFRGLALVSKFSDSITRKQVKPKPYSIPETLEVSLDDLWKDHERER
jgi:hypothetical protein